MPNQTESTGSHSRKMLFAEIPALFYLIISGYHSGRHKPLLRTFTGTVQKLPQPQNSSTNYLPKYFCTEELHRTKRVSATFTRKKCR